MLIIVITSKFEFKNELIFSPKIYIIIPINRKRKNLPIIDAIINFFNSKLSTPAVKVNTLYGIGVKAAVIIIQNPNLENKFSALII